MDQVLRLTIAALVLLAGLAVYAQTTTTDRSFVGKAVTRTATIRLEGPVEKVFPLFGPVDEARWVAGWDPQVIYPAGAKAAEGLVFVTREHAETTWVMAEYDPARLAVTYYNVTPGYQVRKIAIRCRAVGGATEATVAYSYVGLSETGNKDVEEMTESNYAAKMEHWTVAINHYLKTGKTMTHP